LGIPEGFKCSTTQIFRAQGERCCRSAQGYTQWSVTPRYLIDVQIVAHICPISSGAQLQLSAD
jgi:hypothetical protein